MYYAGKNSTSNEVRIGFNAIGTRQWAFQADGTQHSASSTSWTLISDSRLKEQITDVDCDQCLTNINDLNLKQFKYTAKHREHYGLPD